MNLKIVALTAVAVLAMTFPAMAQSTGGGQQGQQLDAIKAKIIARLQAIESCVQAAPDAQALRACKPSGGRGGRGGEAGGADAGGGE